MNIRNCIVVLLIGIACNSFAQEGKPFFSSMDVFGLQYVQEPRVSPDGKTVVYRRMQIDIQQDAAIGNLWRVSSDGSRHEKLTLYDGNESGVAWSPSGVSSCPHDLQMWLWRTRGSDCPGVSIRL